MANSPVPRSPFAAGIDPFDDTPIRSVEPEELAQILAAHELYVRSDRRSGNRADLRATNLSGRNFSGMKLRRIRMNRAELVGADFEGSNLRRVNMIGAKMQRGRLAFADLTRGKLSGINLAEANCEGAQGQLATGGAPGQGNAVGGVCQWLNIGSRVNREVHARFWERLGVRFPRATRQ